MSRIQKTLEKMFDRHRIIFWYDAKKELRSDFEQLEMPDAEKIEIHNNEFGIKHRILREQPKQKFLLYHEGPQPDDIDNWLLDVQLAHGELRTDQAAVWLGELGLGPEYSDIVHNHAEFFQAVKRMEALKSIVDKEDTPGLLQLKMLAVCTNADARIDDVLENLLVELTEDREEKIKLIARCHLDEFLWQRLQRFYGYQSETPGIKDFAIQLFKSCYAMGAGGETQLNGDALVFLKRWKDSRRYGSSFEVLSREYEATLNIEEDLAAKDYHDLIDMDLFRLIDQKIISGLVQDIAERTISSGECARIVRQRRQSHWYDEFSDLYQAAEYAARFFQTMDLLDLSVDSMADGVNRYRTSWFELDQIYRKFTYHARHSGQTTILQGLTEQIENHYSNNYLLTVNNNWQAQIDQLSKWHASGVPSQASFFEHWIRPFPRKNKKVFVIISDGLRYEIANELMKLIRREDRYEAKLEAMLSTLPSYTQLGMAALLPNKQISIADNESGTILVDEVSTQGTENRAKILEQSVAKNPAVIKADALMALNKEDCRGLVRDSDVVYVYHNQIDATGDKRDTEERVFEAVEETLEELLKIIKKLASANATNLIVTADHGFIYQNRILDESDFAGGEVTGNAVLKRDRRFAIGHGLKENSSFKKFTSSELGLSGDVEIQIPKSINRLRLKGSGSRYVHGGASLQEVIVPVLEINKKRKSDISAVDVDIIQSATTVITSGQLAVIFYQTDPVTEKMQARQLKAGIYSQEGELISDAHTLAFDLTSENARERETKIRFVLSREADKLNGQEVILRLDETISGTSHEMEYKSVRYTLRRAITSDFDF